MTLEEKLAHFKECALQDANSQSDKIVNECRQKIKEQYDAYEKEAAKKSEHKLKIESANLLKDKNKALSVSTTNIKRQVSERADELKNSLFDDVEKKIKDYKKSSDYKKLLVSMIDNCLKIAGKEELEIYIDSSDKKLKSDLEKNCNISLIISDNDFLGGIRAICKSKNLLIDNSFASRFAEEKSTFTF